jgi:hypothetical protein
MIDLDELEKLANLAKPLPWYRHSRFSDFGAPITEVRTINKDMSIGTMLSCDANYIVAACNAVPELIKRIRELEAEAENFKNTSKIIERIRNDLIYPYHKK